MTEEFNAASEGDRPEVGKRLAYWEDRLEATRANVEKEKSIFETIPTHLDDLNREQLNEYLDYWKQKLK